MTETAQRAMSEVGKLPPTLRPAAHPATCSKTRALKKSALAIYLLELLIQGGFIEINHETGKISSVHGPAVADLANRLQQNFATKSDEARRQNHWTAAEFQLRLISARRAVDSTTNNEHITMVCMHALEYAIEHCVLLKEVGRVDDTREVGSRVFTSTTAIIVDFMHTFCGVWWETPHRNSAAKASLAIYMKNVNEALSRRTKPTAA